MFTLYCLIMLMLFTALALIAVPFIKNRSWKKFLLAATLTSIFALSLYQFSGDKSALHLWFANGKQHYQLMETFEQLGGIDGAIARIESRLENNPTDAQGWFILGKLYLSKQDNTKAKSAFDKAHALKPDDLQISRYFEMNR